MLFKVFLINSVLIVVLVPGSEDDVYCDCEAATELNTTKMNKHFNKNPKFLFLLDFLLTFSTFEVLKLFFEATNSLSITLDRNTHIVIHRKVNLLLTFPRLS